MIYKDKAEQIVSKYISERNLLIKKVQEDLISLFSEYITEEEIWKKVPEWIDSVTCYEYEVSNGGTSRNLLVNSEDEFEIELQEGQDFYKDSQEIAELVHDLLDSIVECNIVWYDIEVTVDRNGKIIVT